MLFPEIEKLVSTLHIRSIYALLSEFPSTKAITNADLNYLTKLLSKTSRGCYTEKTVITFQASAKKSIGSNMPAKSLELKHTIRLIKELSKEIKEIESEISFIMTSINSPITTIPGVGENMAAMIIAEVGDFSNFESSDKILAFSGFSPSTYQSGQMYSTHAKMEKRGSKYLRYAIN